MMVKPAPAPRLAHLIILLHDTSSWSGDGPPRSHRCGDGGTAEGRFDIPRPRRYASNVSDDLFPSGPWTGFYNYFPGDKHRMDLALTFANGEMTGDGNDDVGRFTIKGRYDVANRECYWTKHYVGAHGVHYRGFREGKGIWGTWEINSLSHGGFHIWPKAAGAGDIDSRSAEEALPADVADAIAAPASVRVTR